MSRTYFHSPSGEAELLGAEQAHLGVFVRDLAVGMLNLDGLAEDIMHLRSLVPRDHYLTTYPAPDQKDHLLYWGREFATAFRTDSGGADGLLEYCGRKLNPHTLALNTALTLGSDPVKLAARIAGQAEIHGWVDGPNRAWLAGIIRDGLDTGVFRSTLRYQSRLGDPWQETSLGWENVIAFLLARQDEPVVLSYSVCEGFPSMEAARWPEIHPEDPDGNLWRALPLSEQWARCMSELRRSDGMLELTPYTWNMRFGDGLSVLDITAQDWEERIRSALRIPVGAESD
jgi:hypothetical protein